MAAMFCSECGTPTIAGDRYCRRCGAAIFEATVDLPRSGLQPAAAPAVALPAAATAYAPAGFGSSFFPSEGDKPLLMFDVAYPERLSRWKIFVKWLLIIPHMVVLYLYAIAVNVVNLIAWFAILFTGRYPEGMFVFTVNFLRWGANVQAYVLLLRDEYPPFSGVEGLYPVQYTLAYPTHLSRWKIFLKWIMVFPNAIVFMVYVLAVYVALFVAWWAILFTGRHPAGLFAFIVGVLRWAHRLNAYQLLLTDRYPPFTTAAIPNDGQQQQMLPA